MVLDYPRSFGRHGTPRPVIENLPEDLRDYVRFAATCGIRKGELSAFRWDMLQGSTLHVPASICKNRKGRTLPLVGEMLAVVERQKVRRRVEVNGVIEMCPYIFHRAGECVPVGEFRKSWKSACRKAGRPGHFFHWLRRFACGAMRDAGIPQVVAMKVSGHKTDSMWRRCALADGTDMREALARVEQFRTKASKLGKESRTEELPKIKDGTENGKPLRMYLCAPDPDIPPRLWS